MPKWSVLKVSKVLSLLIIMAMVLAMVPMYKHAEIPTDAVMFQDFEGDGHVFTAAQNATGSKTTSADDVYEGSHSLKYEVLTNGDPSQSSQSISITSIGNSVDATGMDYLVFIIKDTQGSNTIKVSLTDSSGKSTDFAWQSMSTKRNEWVRYDVPMNGFTGIDKSKISDIRIGQWNGGIYYIDQVFFAKTLPELSPISPKKPTAYYPAGEYDHSVHVELRSDTENVRIYYTTDGTTPDKHAIRYRNPIKVDSSVTITAVTYHSKDELYSEVSILKYDINKTTQFTKPKATPAEGTYPDSQQIELSTSTEGATIFYTTDGSEVTTSALEYTGLIEVSANMVIKAIAVKDDLQSEVAVKEYVIDKNPTPFLKTDGKKMRNHYGAGEEIVLRGTNAGGWLVMEGWMSPTNALDQKTALETLTARFGEETAWELINVYQDHYWTESDFEIIKKEGMNVIRLPFSYFEMLNEDGSLKTTAFNRMDWFIEEAGKKELYVIFDMHGAPGSQNGKDHSGDTTIPDVGDLYGNKENMDRTVFLWEKIAERYKDHGWVAGYDVLNEPGGAAGDEQFNFYDRLYQAIRNQDPNHIIFIEAIWDPIDLPSPDLYGWENVVYSYHFYGWDDMDSYQAQKKFIDHKKIMVNETNYKVPLLVGEFTLFNNLRSWEYALNFFEKEGWSYTTWTYKVTGEGSSWGLYTGNPPKVNIQSDSEEVIRNKWSNVGTDKFIRSNYIADTLRNYSTPDFRSLDKRTWIANFENVDASSTFETGARAMATVDFEKKSDGKASLQLVISDEGKSDVKEQYVSFKAPAGSVFNMDDELNTFPKYLVLDVYNATRKDQTATITLIDANGNEATAKTYAYTKALANSWSKVPLLLKTIKGRIDKSNIVELRIAMEDSGTYHFDNIFIGQSFANNLPDEDLGDPGVVGEKNDSEDVAKQPNASSTMNIYLMAGAVVLIIGGLLHFRARRKIVK